MKKFLFIILLPAWCSELVAQHEAADKKIDEIEAYKKFSVRNTSSKDIATMNSYGENPKDTSIRIISIADFSSSKGIGKSVQRTRYQGTEIKRTTYFGSNSELFAINDSVWYDNHTKRVFTYYFDNGKFSAVDEARKDATERIDKKQIYEWLENIYSIQDLKQWKIMRQE